MKYITQTLRGLAQRSNDIEFLPLGFEGKYHIISKGDLKFLLDQQANNKIQISFNFKKLPIDEDFTIGENYDYKVIVKIPETPSNFFSDARYLLGYIISANNIIDWNNKIVLPFEVIFHPEQEKYKAYFIFLNRLICLYKKNAYYDSKRLVLFSDKPLPIPLFLPKQPFQKFKSSFDAIDKKAFTKSIDGLESFLNNEIIEVHKKEKQKIFLMESYKLLQHCEQSERLYRLIESIEKIENSVDNSFRIYLDNFSYQRLELELKKDLDYFVKSINDAVGSLQTQALGLPVAAALIQISRLNSKVASSNVLYTPYIALIIFSLFVCFNVYQQSIQMQYIQASIKRFFIKDTVSVVLDNDSHLRNMNKLLDKRILMTNIYMIMVLCLSITIICYSLNLLV